MNKNKTCRTCDHWFTPHKRSEAQQGLCRGVPPSVTMTGESKFPTTLAGTACGCWTKIEDEETIDKPAEAPKMNDLVLTSEGPALPPSDVVVDPLGNVVNAAILAEKATTAPLGQVFGNSPKPEIPVLPSGDSPAKKNLPPLTINQAKRFMKR